MINEDIFYNIVKDWEKRNISTEDKGEFIKAYLEHKGISQRELAKNLGINRSTLNDWVTSRQKAKYDFKKHNEIYTISDRLAFLLYKKPKISDKEIEKLKILKDEIEKLLNRLK